MGLMIFGTNFSLKLVVSNLLLISLFNYRTKFFSNGSSLLSPNPPTPTRLFIPLPPLFSMEGVAASIPSPLTPEISHSSLTPSWDTLQVFSLYFFFEDFHKKYIFNTFFVPGNVRSTLYHVCSLG